MDRRRLVEVNAREMARAGGLSVLVVLAGLLSVAGVGAEPAREVRVQLLAFNDFHGQLQQARELQGRPVGGAAVLAAYLRAASAQFSGDTLIVHAGDHVGASPLESALLQDEPAIQFLNLLGNRFCTPQRRLDPRCNLVGTLGNHEFDDGLGELLRLLRGGNAAAGPFLEAPYRGAHFPYVSANVVYARDGRNVLPAFVIKRLGGVRVAVIGAVLAATPSMVVAQGVREVRFLPEPEAINRAVAHVRRAGVEAVIVTIHQGSAQPPYEGPTRPAAAPPEPLISGLVAQLDGAVDVVVSGHAHAFSNALLPNRAGRSVLVTQALSAGSAFAQIALTLDRTSGDVLAKSASIIPTYADAPPGNTPAADVAQLVQQARERVAPLAQRVVGSTLTPLSREPNAAGETALGNLIADAQRKAAAADVALMNLGGIRADLDAGEITYAELFAVQPFGNSLVTLTLSGAQLLRALEQQWRSTPPRLLQVSGLSYEWDPRRPVGERVLSARVGGAALEPERRYKVAANNFLAEGGGDFAMLREAGPGSASMLDLDCLVAYIEGLPGPLHATLDGRVRMR